MNPFNQRLNEIIFERRNKSYGAYVLRKEYPESLRIALFIAAVVAGLAVLSGLFFKRDVLQVPDIAPPLDDTGIVICIFPPPPPPDKPEEHARVLPPPAPLPQTPPEVVNDPVEANEPAPAENPSEADPSNTSETGESGSPYDGPDDGRGGVIELPPAPPAPLPPVIIASKMPTIKGGIIPYLQNNLKYPYLAKENRTSGVVYVSFVVERDGSISNINILNDPKVGDGCEEEAIRVIRSAKWYPGENNGQPVRVQLSVPVRYQIQ